MERVLLVTRAVCMLTDDLQGCDAASSVRVAFGAGSFTLSTEHDVRCSNYIRNVLFNKCQYCFGWCLLDTMALLELTLGDKSPHYTRRPGMGGAAQGIEKQLCWRVAGILVKFPGIHPAMRSCLLCWSGLESAAVGSFVCDAAAWPFGLWRGSTMGPVCLEAQRAQGPRRDRVSKSAQKTAVRGAEHTQVQTALHHRCRILTCFCVGVLRGGGINNS